MAENIYSLRLLDIVPSSLQGDEQVRAAAQAVDAEFQRIAEGEIRKSLILPRLDELPVSMVDLLAWQWHVDFYDGALSLERKRNLIRRSIAWHRIKGTPAAAEEVVKAAYGNCTLTEWFEYGGKPYFFRVAVTLEEESIDKNRWKNVIAAINSVKNTRSWLESIKFHYPEIILPIKITYSAETTGIVAASYSFWNRGAATFVRRNAQYKRNGAVRRNKLDPDAFYRQRQYLAASMLAKIYGYHIITLNPLANSTGKNNASVTVSTNHSAESLSHAEPKLSVISQNQSSTTEQISVTHSANRRVVNLRNKTHARDGAYKRNGRYLQEKFINQICTVRTVENGVPGRVERL